MWIFGYGSLLWKTNFPYQEKKNGYIKKYVRRFWQASLDHRGTLEKPGRVVTLIYTEDPNDVVWGTAFRVAPDDIPSVLEYLDFREKNGYVKHRIPFHAVRKMAAVGSHPDHVTNAITDGTGPETVAPSTVVSERTTSLDHCFTSRPTSTAAVSDVIDRTACQLPVEPRAIDAHHRDEPGSATSSNDSTRSESPPPGPDGTGLRQPNGEVSDFELLEVEAYIADETNPHFLGPAPLESMAEQILTSFGVSGHNLEYLLNLWKVLKEIAPADHHEPHLNELVNSVNVSPVNPQKTR